MGKQRDQPATNKQQVYIQRLLRTSVRRNCWSTRTTGMHPRMGTQNAFICQVQEDFAEPMSRMENYLDYVSHRPGVHLDG